MDKIKHFYLKRIEDVSGTSGTGIVAVGSEFPSGHCIIEWLTFTSSIAIYKNVKDLEAIHSHGGKTKIVYGDLPTTFQIEWRDVKNYEGKYQISNLGQIKSLIGKEKYLKPDIDKDGYFIYTLSSKKFKAHRLTLETFKGSSPEDKTQCRHLDGNPSNNYIENLQWGTQSENENDKLLHGTGNQNEGSGKTKLSNAQVILLRKEYESKTITRSLFIKIKAKELGMSESGIRQILKRESFKSLK